MTDLAPESRGEAALLLLLALFIVLRFLALHGGRLAWEASRRLYNRLSRVSTWDRTERFIDELRRRFPRGMGFLDARLTPRRFNGLPLTLLLLACAYAAGLYLEMVEEVLEAREVAALDRSVDDALKPWRSPAAVAAFRWITNLGSTETLTAVSIVATGFLFACRGFIFVPPLWVCIAGSQLTTWIGKYAIARPRPEFILGVRAISPSFPSAHATGACAVYGFIAYVLVRHVKHARRRFEVSYWTAMLVLLIAFSRVFLGVHFLSDVTAGLVVGGFWLLAGVALTEIMARREPSRAK